MESANSHYYTFIQNSGTKSPFGCTAAVRTPGSCGVMAAEDWFDMNLFADPFPATRFGIEYANTVTTYVDGEHAIEPSYSVLGLLSSSELSSARPAPRPVECGSTSKTAAKAAVFRL